MWTPDVLKQAENGLVAATSSRLLTLLSLLGARPCWTGHDLAARLEVSTRTLRRDVDNLREIGYPVHTVTGPAGGYRLGRGGRLPPLLLDDDQAIAVAVALQTAPSSVSGIDDALARALASITDIMPAPLRAQVEAMHLTAVRNSWDFAGPPLPAATLATIGAAVRNAQLLLVDHLTPDDHRPDPTVPDFAPPRRLEPHHLVLWAGRWYLVAFDVADGIGGWGVHRIDRLRVHGATGVPFQRRTLPEADVAQYVRRTYDRGDTPARWQCLGVAELSLPAEVVARWAPGGSVVEYVGPDRTRITLGAWSWAGIAGLLATFDAEVSAVEPDELRVACRTMAGRFSAGAS